MKRTTTFVCPFIILIWMLTVFACTPRQQSAVMERADSLMDTRPDSALTLLNTLLPDTNAMSKRDLMRFHLLRTNAQNKCDTVFTARHAALMRRVCDYYDRKSPSPFGEGSGGRLSNSRMLAHYLLGRCYSDMGEAPAALQEFHNAADVADTTNLNCSYNTLGKVFSQSANLLLGQEAPLDALDEMKKVEKVALRTSDTFLFLVNRERMAVAYEMLGTPDTAISIRKSVAKVFEDMDMKADASIALAPAIDNAIDLGELEMAGDFIKAYELNSGLYHNGVVAKGQEIYYYSKGMYLLKKGMFDVAEKNFRMLQHSAHSFPDLESAYRGLSKIFQQTGRYDSASIYALKALEMNDSVYRHATSNYYQKLQSLYNYSRFQKAAAEERAKKVHTRTVFYNYLIGSILIITLMLFILYIQVRRNKEHKANEAELEEKYQLLLADLEELKTLKELDYQNATRMAEAKEIKIEHLKAIIARP